MTETAPASPPEGLLAKAQRIRTLAEDVRNEQRLAKDTDKYSDRLDHVREIVEDLVPLATCQDVLARAGVPFAPSPKASNYTISADQFRDIRQAFRDDPESVFGKPVRDARERAQHLSGGLRKRLEQAWAEHVDATVPTPAHDQLDVFAQIPAFRAVTRRLGTLYETRKRLRGTLPTTDEDIQAPVDLAAQVNSAWGQLGGGAPEPVLDLLRAAAAPRGAPVSALTDSVRDWLDANGVTDALRIRIS